MAPAYQPRFDTIPMPVGMDDAARWTETRLRKRMLSGRWRPDAEVRILAHFGPVRRVVMGRVSLAKNQFRKLCHSLGNNYHQTPGAKHAERGALDSFFGRSGIVTRTGLWPMMRRFQVDLIGYRQMLLRPDWSRELGRPVVRPVDPDWVVARAFDSAPNIPVEIDEIRWRKLPDGRELWAWDCLSIADPNKPHFRVVEAKVDGKHGEDLTAKLFGQTFEGDAYPYRWTQGDRRGQPFLPYSMYAAMRKACLWDPYEGIEVVDGSLDVAAAYSFLQHSVFRASFPQRWGMGVTVSGTSPRQTTHGTRIEVPTDPTSMVHLEPVSNLPQGFTPQVGQWGAGMDVESLARTVGMLERAVSDFDGLDTSHIVHDTANPWSASALSITREGKRVAQEQYTPELMPSDLETLEKLACICNIERATPEPLPESDYLISYKTLPLSGDELASRRTHSAALMAEGRMSIIEAYQAEHPGVTEAEAEIALKLIAEVNAKFGVRAGTVPTAIQIVPPVKPAEGDDPAVTVPAAGAPGTDAPAAVADTALNGAQGMALVDILEKVSAGLLAPSAAKRALRIMNPAADRTEIDSMVDESAAFTPKLAPVTPAPSPQV